MKNNILITGGAGFIGSHVVTHFVNKYPNYRIINLDLLTYAANLKYIESVSKSKNYSFIKADINNYDEVYDIFLKNNISHVIHLAAESHVDRSINEPFAFAKTNIIGTLNLLQAAKETWNFNFKNKLFYHISTDEVYGSLGKYGSFSEKSNYEPHSPYSASKASSDHFVRSYFDTYNLPVKISNCSNNYGPHQNHEKLIPKIINNIILNNKLPIYGDGKNIRDWLYVEDHVMAIDKIFHDGKIGETYNIGSNNEWSNLELVKFLIKKVDKKLNRAKGSSEKLINFVTDRAGHDFRYSIDNTKIKKELRWNPTVDFDSGIDKTIDWYLINNYND